MNSSLIRSLKVVRTLPTWTYISTRAFSRMYTAQCTAIGGREGQVKCDDHSKHLNLKLTQPKELGGNDDSGTNPEELFAAGYSSCFLAAMGLAAKNLKKSIPNNSSVTAVIHLGKHQNGNFGFQVELTAKIPGAEQADADALVQAAHQICPYSHATRNNIDVKIKATT